MKKGSTFPNVRFGDEVGKHKYLEIPGQCHCTPCAPGSWAVLRAASPHSWVTTHHSTWWSPRDGATREEKGPLCCRPKRSQLAFLNHHPPLHFSVIWVLIAGFLWLPKVGVDKGQPRAEPCAPSPAGTMHKARPTGELAPKPRAPLFTARVDQLSNHSTEM